MSENTREQHLVTSKVIIVGVMLVVCVTVSAIGLVPRAKIDEIFALSNWDFQANGHWKFFRVWKGFQPLDGSSSLLLIIKRVVSANRPIGNELSPEQIQALTKNGIYYPMAEEICHVQDVSLMLRYVRRSLMNFEIVDELAKHYTRTDLQFTRAKLTLLPCKLFLCIGNVTGHAKIRTRLEQLVCRIIGPFPHFSQKGRRQIVSKCCDNDTSVRLKWIRGYVGLDDRICFACLCGRSYTC